MIAGDDQAARVGHAPAYLSETPVGCFQHAGDPLPVGIEGRAQAKAS